MAVTTLRSLIEEHPEWADLPLVVYREDGEYDWVGCSGAVYDHNPADDGIEDAQHVLVFAGN